MTDNNDPVAGMSRLTAKLFAFMAAEVIARCGEERGTEIVKSAVRKFGLHRGGLRRDATLKAGQELSLENFEAFGDLPDNDVWDADTVIEDRRLSEFTRYCPFADAWRELGMEKIGSLYCAVDEALLEGYFGDDFQFERPQLFCDAQDAPCDMIVTLGGRQP